MVLILLFVPSIGPELIRWSYQVIDSQFAFQRTDTRTAVAGLKLILLRDLIEILQSPDILTNQEHRWQPVLDFIQNNLSPVIGLPPPDRFAGDISGAV